MKNRYKSFKEFYSFYLTEHCNTVSRRLHFIGTAMVFVIIFLSIIIENYHLLWAIPLVGYGFAWVGHYYFEKNRPATFRYPLYSLLSDFRLFFEILSGKEKI